MLYSLPVSWVNANSVNVHDNVFQTNECSECYYFFAVYHYCKAYFTGLSIEIPIIICYS